MKLLLGGPEASGFCGDGAGVVAGVGAGVQADLMAALMDAPHRARPCNSLPLSSKPNRPRIK